MLVTAELTQLLHDVLTSRVYDVARETALDEASRLSERLGNEVLTTDGTCEGIILDAPRGTGGFGDDPLFYAPELGCTFAEAGVGPKNDLSHRARAMRAMRPRLLAYFGLANGEPSG